MVEVQLCTPGGECLARATLPLSSRAADMRPRCCSCYLFASVRKASKYSGQTCARKALSAIEMKGESIFLIGTRVVEEEVTLQGAGAVAASTVVAAWLILFPLLCFLANTS